MMMTFRLPNRAHRGGEESVTLDPFSYSTLLHLQENQEREQCDTVSCGRCTKYRDGRGQNVEPKENRQRDRTLSINDMRRKERESMAKADSEGRER